jgi:hypothetical protein
MFRRDEYFWAVFTLIVAVILAIVLLSIARDNEEAHGETLPPKGAFVGVKTPWDAQMVALDQEALDEAYRSQLEHLFAIWMKDDAHQPQRAITGAQQARRAYILVMREIEKRKKALEEMPVTNP